MTDLERFFRHLVRTLATTDTARLRQPIPLSEIRGSIMPYRLHRGALQIESSEDYDLLLMRLCAGEGALARTSPDEAGMQFEQELASSHPHLGVLRQFADALVSLTPDWVTAVAMGGDLGGEVERAVERDHPPEPTPAIASAPTKTDAPADPTRPTAAHCFACGETFPQDLPVKFCPYCGTSQMPPRCSACDTELQSGWRFCPRCGQGA